MKRFYKGKVRIRRSTPPSGNCADCGTKISPRVTCGRCRPCYVKRKNRFGLLTTKDVKIREEWDAKLKAELAEDDRLERTRRRENGRSAPEWLERIFDKRVRG